MMWISPARCSRLSAVLLVLVSLFLLRYRASAQSLAPFSIPSQAAARASDHDSCRSNPSALAIEGQIRRLVNLAQWSDLEKAGAELTSFCPDSDLGYHWLGVGYLRQGRSFAAIRAFEESLQRRDDAGAHLLLAEAYFKLGQDQFFWEEIEIAKKMAPEESGIYYLAGLYVFQTEDAYDKAAVWFRQALERNSGHVLARCYLALCLRALQQDLEAASLLLEAVGPESRAGAESVILLQLLVSLELDLGRTSEAFAHATLAARLAPGSAKVQLGLGRAAWHIQDQGIALHALKTAAKLDPRLPDPHYLLGRIYAAQGDGRGAAEELARFKELKERARGTDQ